MLEKINLKNIFLLLVYILFSMSAEENFCFARISKKKQCQFFFEHLLKRDLLYGLPCAVTLYGGGKSTTIESDIFQKS